MFENSPFDLCDKAFKNLYPEKSYKAYIDENMQDETGERVYGCTIFFDDDEPIVAIDAELSIKNAIEIYAHELAHVAVGEGIGHGEEWEKAFENIREEYHRVGSEMF